jgi:hypothetical protein
LGRRIACANAAAALLFVVVLVGGAGGADTEVPKVTNLRAEPGRFCAVRSSTCTNPGTRIRFNVSTGATVTGNIWPRRENLKGYVEFRRHFNAGPNSIRMNDRRLTPGRWTFKVQGLNSVGSGTTAIVDVRVVK